MWGRTPLRFKVATYAACPLTVSWAKVVGYGEDHQFVSLFDVFQFMYNTTLHTFDAKCDAGWLTHQRPAIQGRLRDCGVLVYVEAMTWSSFTFAIGNWFFFIWHLFITQCTASSIPRPLGASFASWAFPCPLLRADGNMWGWASFEACERKLRDGSWTTQPYRTEISLFFFTSETLDFTFLGNALTYSTSSFSLQRASVGQWQMCVKSWLWPELIQQPTACCHRREKSESWIVGM